MSINSNWLYRVFKYTIYVLLTYNIYEFWKEDYLAAALQFSGNIPFSQIIGAFPATIDTAAWVVLLLIFELETYVLEDKHFTPVLTRTLQATRLICYGFIFYALYGYLVKLGLVYDTSPLAGVADICNTVLAKWSYAIDLDEYTRLTAANCMNFSSATAYFQFNQIPALVDANGLRDIRYLAWVDVINAAVWIMVVLILEFDVYMQERDRFVGTALKVSNLIKVVLYSTLLAAAIYWGFKGDFIDFWDAFLWLLAFFFIELNVIEWRQEALDTANSGAEPA